MTVCGGFQVISWHSFYFLSCFKDSSITSIQILIMPYNVDLFRNNFVNPDYFNIDIIID